VATTVALAAVVANPSGFHHSDQRSTLAAAVSSPTIGGGFDFLTERLRMNGGAGVGDAASRSDSPSAGDVAIAPPPESFSEPPPPPAPPPAQLRRTQFDGVVPTGGVWAVMIGINDYPGTNHDLNSAVNDAEDVNAALAKLGVSGDRRLLVRDTQATAGTIRTAVDWLNAHAGRDATAVFFYAGHIRKLGSGSEALVGSDGGTVSDVELARLLEPLQAARTWIALAGCYAGGFTEVLRPGRILTAAAPADSLAYENESFGRSYLVEYMVRRAMINANTSVIESAFNAAQAGLKRDFPNRVPVQFDALDGDLDLRPPATARPATATSTGGSTGGSSSGGSSGSTGGGGSGPGGSGSTPPPDNCSNITIGLVRCEGH